jgi:chromosome segregation ATPase
LRGLQNQGYEENQGNQELLDNVARLVKGMETSRAGCKKMLDAAVNRAQRDIEGMTTLLKSLEGQKKELTRKVAAINAEVEQLKNQMQTHTDAKNKLSRTIAENYQQINKGGILLQEQGVQISALIQELNSQTQVLEQLKSKFL